MRHRAAGRVAYPAVLGAVSLLFVYVASVAPSGSWGLVAAAGLFPAAAVISVGLGAGFLCWGGVSLLAFLLLPEKFCALLYAVLFGLYPLVKSLIERLRKRWPEYILKLLFFNAAFTLVLQIMGSAVAGTLPGVLLERLWALYLTANVVFLLYDYGFSRLISFYVARIAWAVR